MATELFDTLTGAHIPEARSPVDTSREAVVTCEVELTAGQLRCVARKREQALSRADIPNLCRVIEGSGHEFVAVSVEIERYNFRVMTF